MQFLSAFPPLGFTFPKLRCSFSFPVWAVHLSFFCFCVCFLLRLFQGGFASVVPAARADGTEALMFSMYVPATDTHLGGRDAATAAQMLALARLLKRMSLPHIAPLLCVLNEYGCFVVLFVVCVRAGVTWKSRDYVFVIVDGPQSLRRFLSRHAGKN